MIDSFTTYFKNTRTKTIVNIIIEAFKESDDSTKLVISVMNVIMTKQRTGWEYGYRVIKIVDLLIQSDFNIDCLKLFYYDDFMENYVMTIAETVK